MYKEEEKNDFGRNKGGKEILTKQMALKKNTYFYRWLVADWFKNVDWKLCGKCEAKHRDKFN